MLRLQLVQARPTVNKIGMRPKFNKTFANNFTHSARIQKETERVNKEMEQEKLFCKLRFNAFQKMHIFVTLHVHIEAHCSR